MRACEKEGGGSVCVCEREIVCVCVKQRESRQKRGVQEVRRTHRVSKPGVYETGYELGMYEVKASPRKGSSRRGKPLK